MLVYVIYICIYLYLFIYPFLCTLSIHIYFMHDISDITGTWGTSEGDSAERGVGISGGGHSGATSGFSQTPNPKP